MSLPIWEQVHLSQHSFRFCTVLCSHAQTYFIQHAFCEKLVVYVLHHHITELQPLFSGINPALFLHSAAAPLFQPAQAAGQGGFSRSVMPNDCGCTAKGEFHLVNVQGFRLMLLGKGDLPDFPFGVPGPAVRQRYPL